MTKEILEKLNTKLKHTTNLTKKQTEKLIEFCIKTNLSDLNEIYELIVLLKQKMKHCAKCKRLQDLDVCEICNNNTRENKILLVSKDSDIDKFDALGIYKGKYFVFSSIYQLKKNNDLFYEEFNDLIKLIDKNTEVIFALPFSLEGQLTMEYIKKLLIEKFPTIFIYQLSIGLPINASVEYADPITLKQSLLNKQKM